MTIKQIEQRLKTINDKCLDVFANYCANKSNLRLEHLPEDILIFQITGGLESDALSRSQKIKVVNLFEDYWLAFTIFFGINPIPSMSKHFEYFIHEIYLKIYYGLNLDIDKQLLFRAEWSRNDSGPFEHAQPHWHFHPHEIFVLAPPDTHNFFIELKEEEKELVDVNQSSQKVNSDISRFHFSMTNDWHNGNTRSHMITLDENNIVNWLGGLLKHISNQLKYCN
jgi:hypothetical protein